MRRRHDHNDDAVMRRHARDTERAAEEAMNMPLHNLVPSPWDEVTKQKPREATEFERDDLLEDVERGVACAVRDGRVLVQTSRGACVVRVETVGRSEIVLFDHIEADDRSRPLAWVRRTFWFNKHSVARTGEKLRSLPRREWSELLMEVVL